MLTYFLMRLFSVALISVGILATAGCRDMLPAKQGPVGNFNMGERAQVGPLIYTVFDSRWMLSLGDQPTPRIPTDRFLLINVSVVNSGSQPVSIPTISLVDDSGRVYEELDNGEGVKLWLGFVRRVRPAESTDGTIVFDVPQKHFKLRVADEEEQFAYVDIPLTLGEAPPDLSPKGPGR